jgi:rod shape determining protein RodA
MQPSTRIWRHFDTWLLAAVAVLTISSVAMIRSAIGGNENLQELVPRQAIYAVIGLAVVLILAAVDYRFWSAVARPLYVVIVVILALIPIAGFVGFGSARWFNVGIVLIQPSEISKVLMIIVLADYFSRHRGELSNLRVLAGSLILVAIPAALLFLQPDLSSTVDLAVIWLALVFAAGIPLPRLGAVLGAGIVVPVATWPLLQTYQKARLVTFLFPDPEAQFGATYNVIQALISIGSGGWFGKGYGHGTQVQLRFLKVRHTDFIYSALAEEFGFVGAVVILGLLVFVIYRCLRAARTARDSFGSLICYGVALLLLFQAAFNIGMNLNLLPVSGLPLPFFSYGGSSLVASLFGVGLVESVILRHKKIEL